MFSLANITSFELPEKGSFSECPDPGFERRILILAPQTVTHTHHRSNVGIRDVVNGSVKIGTVVAAQVNMQAGLKIKMAAQEKLVTDAPANIGAVNIAGKPGSGLFNLKGV